MAVPPPDEARLREAALAHLARYAATRAGLVRVLDRRVDRWAREMVAEPDAVRAAKAVVRDVVARLSELGAVDDTAFAASRARSLTRAGKSRMAVAAHLAARGVAADTVRAVLPAEGETELAAALAWAKRRRIGPFRTTEVDAEGHKKELGVLARAGFAREVALRALDYGPEEAEALVIELKRS